MNQNEIKLINNLDQWLEGIHFCHFNFLINTIGQLCSEENKPESNNSVQFHHLRITSVTKHDVMNGKQMKEVILNITFKAFSCLFLEQIKCNDFFRFVLKHYE